MPASPVRLTAKDVPHSEWAGLGALQIPTGFLCNASSPLEQPSHPVFGGAQTLLLPANTRVLLFGTSHLRSVRDVLIAAAAGAGTLLSSSCISRSDDCDGATSYADGGPDIGDFKRTCGLFSRPCEKDDCDLTHDRFANGAVLITMVNHRQLQSPQYHNKLQSRLHKDGPYTHGYFQHPHNAQWFDAQCRKQKDGTPPDPTKVGDRVEHPCDIASEECRSSSTLFKTVHSMLPNVAYAAEALRGTDGSGEATSGDRGILGEGSPILNQFGESTFAEDSGHPSMHACDVVCHGVTSDDTAHLQSHCQPWAGAAIAWEVLHAALGQTEPR